LVAVTSVEQNAVLAQTPFGASRVSPETGFMGWLLVQQAVFYRALSGVVRLAKTDGSALWTLMGIAFAYGVFHAAGPGHGKAVISSYLLANDETWRRGVALSFASALLQSLTAVLIVGIAAALLGATAQMMSDAARTIELISYGLIVLLGARLLWVKGLGFIRALVGFRDKRHHRVDDAPDNHPAVAHAHHAHHDHEGDHAHGDPHGHSHADGHGHEPDVLPWGHAHGPEPQDLGGPGGWKRGMSAIVAVGLRPCSGAIILLVFALSQGLFWAGVVSTFVMGLGTAITVAAIATIAVGAKAFAKRFASDEISLGSVLVRGMEVGAAGLILAFGSLLLAGYMASERLAFF
jgi:nickel/cobalt exporter